MQPPPGRPSSPRPLTRRSSRRDIPLSPSKNSNSASPFHLPPVSPTTPTTASSPFRNTHGSVINQSSTPSISPTPPPTPAPSPTASRPVRRLSSRRRTSDPSRKQSDLTRKKSDSTRKQSDLTRKQSDLTRKQSDLTRKKSNRTRQQSLSPDKFSTPPPLGSPRKVRFGGEHFEYLPGDSSDEEEDFYPDPVVESRGKATSPHAKDQEDSRSCTRENSERENSRGSIAMSDNGSSRRGRSSSRSAPGKRSATPFVRRGSNWDEDDEDGEDEARETNVMRGSGSDADESSLKKGHSANERDDNPILRRGRSSSRGAPAKRSATPFARRSSNWEDDGEAEGDDEADNDEKGSVVVHVSSGERSSDEGVMRRRCSVEGTDDSSSSRRRERSSSRDALKKRSSTPLVRRSVNWEDEDEDDGEDGKQSETVVVHASSWERNDDDVAMRKGRNAEEQDDESGSLRRGRSLSRGAPAKRSATPFVRRSMNWEDEDDEEDEEDEEGAEPVSGSKTESTVQFSSRDEGHIRRGRSVSEDDEESVSSRRGRSPNRGARTKRSATPFVRRNTNWVDEDDDDNDGDENGTMDEKNKGKDTVAVHTSNEDGGNDGDDPEKSGISLRRGRSIHDTRAGNAERGRSKSREAAAKRTATPFVRRSVNWENEGAQKVERIGLAVIREIEDCVTILEDENEHSDEPQHADAVRVNCTDGIQGREDTRHRATITANGDLVVMMRCDCGKAQTLTYSTLTGVDIKPC